MLIKWWYADDLCWFKGSSLFRSLGKAIRSRAAACLVDWGRMESAHLPPVIHLLRGHLIAQMLCEAFRFRPEVGELTPYLNHRWLCRLTHLSCVLHSVFQRFLLSCQSFFLITMKNLSWNECIFPGNYSNIYKEVLYLHLISLNGNILPNYHVISKVERWLWDNPQSLFGFHLCVCVCVFLYSCVNCVCSNTSVKTQNSPITTSLPCCSCGGHTPCTCYHLTVLHSIGVLFQEHHTNGIICWATFCDWLFPQHNSFVNHQSDCISDWFLFIFVQFSMMARCHCLVIPCWKMDFFLVFGSQEQNCYKYCAMHSFLMNMGFHFSWMKFWESNCTIIW